MIRDSIRFSLMIPKSSEWKWIGELKKDIHRRFPHTPIQETHVTCMIPEGSVSFYKWQVTCLLHEAEDMHTLLEFWAADFVTITGEETVMLEKEFIQKEYLR